LNHAGSYPVDGGAWFCDVFNQGEACPGGAEIVIDYEAAFRELTTAEVVAMLPRAEVIEALNIDLDAACFSMWGSSRPTGPPSFNTYQRRDMRRAINAALGIGDNDDYTD
jgi:hypothetical protein